MLFAISTGSTDQKQYLLREHLRSKLFSRIQISIGRFHSIPVLGPEEGRGIFSLPFPPFLPLPLPTASPHPRRCAVEGAEEGHTGK